MEVTQPQKLMMDPLILGDNPFFGVNHRSERDAAFKAQRFKVIGNLLHAFRVAKESGAGGVMLSPHTPIHKVVQAVQEDPELTDFNIYPHIPYLMKYVQSVTQKGVLYTLSDVLKSSGPWMALNQLILGSSRILQRDTYRLIQTIVDFEMRPFHGASTPAIFLHNGLVDLMLGLDLKNVAKFYDEYVRSKYGARPGYGTLNLPRLVRFLKDAGVHDPLIMAPFNAIGFHMNPSQKECEAQVRSGGFTLLAMHTLASGAVKPREAFQYLRRFPNIRHTVVGASSDDHIRESFGLLKTS